MPHLAARSNILLAVEMQLRVRRIKVRRDIFGVGPDNVFHANVGEPTGIAEGQSGNRANQLLELIRVTGIDRPMAGIVWPWRNFVCK